MCLMFIVDSGILSVDIVIHGLPSMMLTWKEVHPTLLPAL